MTRPRVWLLVVGLLLCPAVSQAAEGDWWTWLEKMSGPGPFKFKGYMFSERITCKVKSQTGGLQGWIWLNEGRGRDDDFMPCVRDTNDVKVYLEAAFGTAMTDSHSLFSDATSEPQVVAHASVLKGQLMRRSPGGLVAYGGGGGVLWISSPDPYETAAMPMATAALTIRPLRLPWFRGWSDNVRKGLIVFRLEGIFVFGLDATSFKSSSTYKKSIDFVTSGLIGINLGALIK